MLTLLQVSFDLPYPPTPSNQILATFPLRDKDLPIFLSFPPMGTNE